MKHNFTANEIRNSLWCGSSILYAMVTGALSGLWVCGAISLLQLVISTLLTTILLPWPSSPLYKKVLDAAISDFEKEQAEKGEQS